MKRPPPRCSVRPPAGCWRRAVLVSIFGCISSAIIGASRLGVPMSQDAPAFRWMARIHPRYRTPTAGIVTLAVWSMLLVLSGSYEQLFEYSLFSSFIFHAVTGLSLFTLRRKQPNTPTALSGRGIPMGARTVRGSDDGTGAEYPSRAARPVATRRRDGGARCSVLSISPGDARDRKPSDRAIATLT